MRLLWFFEKFLPLSLQIDQATASSHFSDAASWTSSPSLWTFLLLFLAGSFFPTISFSLFYPVVNLNAKFWNLWLVMGSEKDKSSCSLFTHPNGHVTHVAYIWRNYWDLLENHWCGPPRSCHPIRKCHLSIFLNSSPHHRFLINLTIVSKSNQG